jgi:hypothetical protein
MTHTSHSQYPPASCLG